MRVSSPAAFDRAQRGDGLHQRLGGAAGFRDGDEARGLHAAASPSSARERIRGSRLSMKCRRGGSRSASTPGTRVAGQLRQRLPAEAGAAGAENDDVGGALREPLRRRRGSPAGRPASPAAAAAAGRRRRGARASISSAASARSSVAASAWSATPCGPTFFSSALSMDWMASCHGCRIVSAPNAERPCATASLGAVEVSPFGRAGDRDQHAAAVEPLGHALGVLDGHGVDQGAAASGYSRCRDCRAGSG